ncbi:Na(+)/H(+) antiporter NhaP [compost metagenome]
MVFTILLGILQLGETPTVSATTWLFIHEAVGGVLFGAALGYGVFLMMRGIDQYQVEVMLTLALVIGGAALAARLHVSAPIAMVVAGLIIGNHGRTYAMSDETRRYVDKFWELIDEILNALLFALIGLELLLLPFNWLHVVAAFALGGAVLVSRLLTVAPAIVILRQHAAGRRQVPRGTIRILAWGGLRGGVSVALALSLPLGEQRDLLLSLTYVVVLASILIQGLSIGPLVRWIYRGEAPVANTETH